MNKRMRKICLASDYEKIENWLNKQCDKGLAMVSFDRWGLYYFEKCKPSEYTYRMYFMKNIENETENKRFLAFLEETGAERVTTAGRWVFLRRKRELGEFQIFSDLDGKIAHLRQMSKANASVMMICLIGFMYLPTLLSHLNERENPLKTIMLVMMGISFLCYIPCLVVCVKGARKIKKLEKEKQIYE